MAPLGAAGKADDVVDAARIAAKTRRFQGKKPRYHVNLAHVKSDPCYNPKKDPLPDDAKDVFSNAVPSDPEKPKHWYGVNENGDIYWFSDGNDGTAHFSGIIDPKRDKIPPYARDRINELDK